MQQEQLLVALGLIEELKTELRESKLLFDVDQWRANRERLDVDPIYLAEVVELFYKTARLLNIDEDWYDTDNEALMLAVGRHQCGRTFTEQELEDRE